MTMGGPSVKQFVQSPGIHVTPNVDYLGFDVDDPANFRRAIYRFLFRTLAGSVDGIARLPGRFAAHAGAQRSRSLRCKPWRMLDDRFIVRQSEHTAARLTQAAATLPEQVRELFRLTLLRDPAPAELAAWEAYARQHGLANACRMCSTATSSCL